ncbi:hypothetical protein B0H11DRAFT_1899058 [Mycena galericulata]|nr:hypothetical protein B0H11DRAFT_1899058 [Mycena galericulata]
MRIARQVIYDASWIGFSSLPAFPNFNDKRCIRSTASGPKFSGAFNRQVNRGTSNSQGGVQKWFRRDKPRGVCMGYTVQQTGVNRWFDYPHLGPVAQNTASFLCLDRLSRLTDREDNRIYARPSRFRGTSILHSVQLSFRTHRVRQMMQVKSNLPGRNPSTRNARANSDDTRFYVAFRFATSGSINQSWSTAHRELPEDFESEVYTTARRLGRLKFDFNGRRTARYTTWTSLKAKRSDRHSTPSSPMHSLNSVRTAAEIEIGVRVLRCTVIPDGRAARDNFGTSPSVHLTYTFLAWIRLACQRHEFDWSASGKRMRPGSKFDSSSFDSYNVCKCIRFTTSGLKYNQTFNMQANRAIEQTGRSSMVHRALSASLEIVARKSVLDSLR